MFGGGQVPAEDDWVGTAPDQRFEGTNEGIEFRIFRFNEIASLIDERTECRII